MFGDECTELLQIFVNVQNLKCKIFYIFRIQDINGKVKTEINPIV